MLKIWEMKNQADKAKAEGSDPSSRKVTGAQLRIQKDVSELALPDNMSVQFPNPNNLMQFTLYLIPDEGIYRGGHFSFNFRISEEYPIEPPKVTCNQKIYHPNIDLEGNVCLNILREDWKPVLSLNSVVVGIQFLFLEPNQNDPLNRDAALSLHKNYENFAQEVAVSMRGGFVGSERFDSVI